MLRGIGAPELVLILVIVIIVFGVGRLGEAGAAHVLCRTLRVQAARMGCGTG